MPGKVASRCAASSRQSRFELVQHLLYVIHLIPPEFFVFQFLYLICGQTLKIDEMSTV